MANLSLIITCGGRAAGNPRSPCLPANDDESGEQTLFERIVQRELIGAEFE